MHPRLAELSDALTQSRADLEDVLRRVPAQLREARPAVDRWSIAEIVEHLAIVEAGIARLFRKLIGAARAAGAGPDPDTSPVQAIADMSRVLDRSARIEAIENVRPNRHLDFETAWAELRAARTQLLEVMRSASDVNLREIHYEHPALGMLDGYNWLAFTAAHERRHAAQIEEVQQQLLRSRA